MHIQSNEFDDIQINRQINVFWSCQKPGLSPHSNSLFIQTKDRRLNKIQYARRELLNES